MLLASRRLCLAPRIALCRTSRILPGFVLSTANVHPLRRGIKLRASVKLRVNECPLGIASG
jgi:hypothetical protein